METRNGLIEFRVEQIEVPTNHPGKVRIVDQLQYRQCFKGFWEEWKPVPVVRSKY